MESFTDGYITCALWSSTDSEDEPMDSNYSALDLAPETRARMQADCEVFEHTNADLLNTWPESSARAGHDFWLTRNGHGAGFWDRFNSGTPEGKIGQVLTDLAHAFGMCELYIGDDGLIYC